MKLNTTIRPRRPMQHVGFVLSATLLFSHALSSSADTLFTETFETDGLGTRYTTGNVFNDAGNPIGDYYTRIVDAGDGPNPPIQLDADPPLATSESWTDDGSAAETNRYYRLQVRP